jgi:hypothetical protein
LAVQALKAGFGFRREPDGGKVAPRKEQNKAKGEPGPADDGYQKIA